MRRPPDRLPTGGQTAARIPASRPAAARSVSRRFGNAKRSLVRPSSGREKNDEPGPDILPTFRDLQRAVGINPTSQIAAALSVSNRFGNANLIFVRPSSGRELTDIAGLTGTGMYTMCGNLTNDFWNESYRARSLTSDDINAANVPY